MTQKINAALIVFPASNCDADLFCVLQKIFKVPVEKKWHKEHSLPSETTHVFLPGGFSFGDYLRGGAMAAHSPIMAAVKTFAENGGKVLGICNGFQILCEAKLLPGALVKNDSNRFVCKKVKTTWRSQENDQGESLTLPIAHAEGKYFASDDDLSKLEENQQIILRYEDCDQKGNGRDNGSLRSIAGIVGGINKNILGMMPHPERACFSELGSTDGQKIFQKFLFG